jgi:hypothetical protein
MTIKLAAVARSLQAYQLGSTPVVLSVGATVGEVRKRNNALAISNALAESP